MRKLLERIKRLENMKADKDSCEEPAIAWQVLPGESQADELARFRVTHPGVDTDLLTSSWLHNEPVPNLIFL